MKSIYRHGLNAVVLVVIATSSFKVPAQSNYYRWLDSGGNPIVSDRPPPAGTDYEVVSTQATLKRTVEAEEGAVPLAIDPTTGAELTQRESPEAAAERIKKNAELCAMAKSNLDALSGRDTVAIRDSKGEVKELNPQEMELQRETTKAQIKVYCAK